MVKTKTTHELAEEPIDESRRFPRTWSELKKIVLQGMALEREACARDVEEISPDAASVIRSRKVKAF